MLGLLLAALVGFQAEGVIHVTVTGAVVTPKECELPAGSHLLHALTAAGGVDFERANLHRGVLQRAGSAERIPLDLHRIYREGDLAQNYVLRDGDRINVAELVRRHLWVQAGENPYPLAYESGITLGEALRRVGWRPVGGDGEEVSIERMLPGAADPVFYRFKVSSLLEGPKPPAGTVLQEGDIIHVAHGSVTPRREESGRGSP